MSAGPITGASSAAGTSRGSFANLTTDDFLKVMLSELSHQDPLQPQDSAKLMEQFSSLRNIESQLQLQDQLSSLVLQNQIATAGGMIGKMVAGLDDNNDTIVGLINSVRVQDGKVLLELDTGQSLPMDRVVEIANHTA
ncbi:MAG: flagellar hook capping FlgD N-terminal domain-containing protein [Phycisphaeraceae bacterium]